MNLKLREKYNIPADAVITIGGMVGIGKSTITNGLADALGFRTSLEKVDTNPYLDKFYHDFERWSFHLQIYFLAERFKEQKRIFQYGGGFIQDRSIYEDTGIFAKMHFEKGTMSPTDYETYSSLFEGSFEQVLERIRLRGREMEQQTPIEYWEEMYERYTNWINNFTICPVLRLSIDEYDLLNEPESIDRILAKIEKQLEVARIANTR